MAVHRRFDEIIHEVLEATRRRDEDEPRRRLRAVRERVRHALGQERKVTGPERIGLVSHRRSHCTLEHVDPLVLTMMDVQRKVDRQSMLGEGVHTAGVGTDRLVLRRRLSNPRLATVATAEKNGLSRPIPTRSKN